MSSRRFPTLCYMRFHYISRESLGMVLLVNPKLYDCHFLGYSILFLQNLESGFAGRVVVEVTRSTAEDH